MDETIPIIAVKRRRLDKAKRRAARLELPDPVIVTDLDRRISALECCIQEVRVLTERVRMAEELGRVLKNEVEFIGRFSE